MRVRAEDLRFTEATRITLKTNQVVEPIESAFTGDEGGLWVLVRYAFELGVSRNERRTERHGRVVEFVCPSDVAEIHGAVINHGGAE